MQRLDRTQTLDAHALRPMAGQNCWRKGRAERFGLLVDAQSYFGALYSALLQAHSSILILGWDMDTRLILKPDPDSAKSKRYSLGNVLRRLVNERPNLEVRILCWDFAMIYSLERELFPAWKWRSFSHPRVKFVLDGNHLLGASHHQKIVIIDDQLAFTGGMDLCARRWDTRSHRPNHPLRKDPDGHAYTPFHDIQAVMDGEVARHLADLAKTRWKHATGQEVPDAQAREPGPWPKEVLPEFRKVEVAVARTQALDPKSPDVREVERLYVDMIRDAKHFVYAENQYLTSDRIRKALTERISSLDSPEFIFVLPQTCGGQLEESTMGVLRTRLMRQLQSADRYHKLRFVYPAVLNLKKGRARALEQIPIAVHSKLMIVDDAWLRVGSANLSNRSMGLDSECDVAIHWEGDPHVAKQIGRIRSSLIGEHTGASLERVEELLRTTGSLIQTLDRLHAERGARHSHYELVPIRPILSRWREWLTPGAALLDPDRPIEQDGFFRQFLPKSPQQFPLHRYQRLNLRLIIGIVLATAWSLPHVRAAWPLIPKLTSLRAQALSLSHLWSVLGVLGLGTLLLIPIDLLLVGAMVTLGVAAGTALSAIAFFAIAQILYGAGRFFSKTASPPSPISGYAIDEAGTSPAFKVEGSFWSHALLHAGSIAPYAWIAFRAGKLNTSWTWFSAGLLFGQVFRIPAILVYAAAITNVLLHPGLPAVLLLLTISALLYWTFRSLLSRILSSWSPRRPTFNSPQR